MAVKGRLSRGERRRQRIRNRYLTLWFPLRLLGYLALIGWGIISLVPMFMIFSLAVRPLGEVLLFPPRLIPSVFTLDNFRRIIFGAATNEQFPRWIFNSFFITVPPLLLNLLFQAMVGYAFAKRRFPGRELIFWTMMGVSMIPGQVTMVPIFLQIVRLKLMDTYWAIVLPGIGAGAAFLMRQYLSTLPDELFDAARIDGASEWMVFRGIVLPLAKPPLAFLSITGFIGSWNSFFWVLLVTTTDKFRTLPVGLATLYMRNRDRVDYGIAMAGSVILAIPPIIAFFTFHRYLLQGVRIGALKG